MRPLAFSRSNSQCGTKRGWAFCWEDFNVVFGGFIFETRSQFPKEEERD